MMLRLVVLAAVWYLPLVWLVILCTAVGAYQQDHQTWRD